MTGESSKSGAFWRKRRGIYIPRGHFLSILAAYGLLVLALFGVGWLLGFAVYPPRTAPPATVVSAPTPTPADTARVAAPAAVGPSETPDPLAIRVEAFRTELARLAVPSVGVETGDPYRFVPMPEDDGASEAVFRGEGTWALAVAAGETDDFDAFAELVAAGWNPFRFPAKDGAGNLRWVPMAGEASAAEARAEANRLRAAGFPAIPVQVAELAGIPLRRWARYLGADSPRAPFTLRLASYREEAASRLGMEKLTERVNGLYRVGYDLEGRGRWWSLYAGHFRTAEETRAFARTISGVKPVVREMPYAVLVGLPESEAESAPNEGRIMETLGFSPYLEGISGNFRWLAGAYLKPESARDVAARLRAGGIPAWGVER